MPSVSAILRPVLNLRVFRLCHPRVHPDLHTQKMTQRPTSAASHRESDEEFIDQEDIVDIIEDDGDHPMGEDDDEDGGDRGEDGEELQVDEEIIVEDTSIQSFAEHTQSVFAVASHPTAPLAVSGGEDDAGYLWDTSSGDLIARLDGHEDSVVAVGFNHTGEMVATGGMDGKVRVWKQKEGWKNWEFLVQLDGVDEVVVSGHFLCP